MTTLTDWLWLGGYVMFIAIGFVSLLIFGQRFFDWLFPFLDRLVDDDDGKDSR